MERQPRNRMLSAEDIKSLKDSALLASLDATEEVADNLAETIKDISNELKDFFTYEVLYRSPYWHAFNSSSLPPDLESNEASIEAMISATITSLLNEKILPLVDLK